MNYKKEKILIICLVMIVFVLKAQQQPMFSHFMFNNYFINPGAAGSSDKVNITSIVRNQWQNLEGAPVTMNFSVNAPFNLFGTQSAFGVDALNDRIGFNNDMGLKIAYAIRFPVGTGKLGIGVKGGFLSPSLKVEGGWKTGENDFQTSVENLPTEFSNEFVFDLDAGMFYKTDDLYVGLSSTRIHAPDFEPKRTETGGFIYNYVRHYYFTTGYNIYLANPAFELKPSFIVRSDGKIMDFDINLMIEYNKKVWGGLSYRNDISSYGIAFLGIELIENLNIGLSYDIPSGKVNNYTIGTYEIFINYNFTLSKEKTTQQYKSVRYL